MNASSLQNKKILVVEDNSINQLLVKHSLQKTGALLEFADDGLSAYNAAKANTYDIILMDLQLPEMSGYDVAVKIRKELKSDVPIIAMSAMMFLGEEQKCDDAGMNGYMLKPFSLETFLEKWQKIAPSEAKTETADDHLIKADGLTLDTLVLHNLGGTDSDYLKLLVQTFLDSMSNVMAKLEAAYTEKDYETIRKTAHFAKSSLSVVKVIELFDLMQQLEIQCKNGTELETVGDKLAKVNELYPKAVKMVRTIFQLNEPTEVKPV